LDGQDFLVRLKAEVQEPRKNSGAFAHHLHRQHRHRIWNHGFKQVGNPTFKTSLLGSASNNKQQRARSKGAARPLDKCCSFRKARDSRLLGEVSWQGAMVMRASPWASNAVLQ
jgi:hypothetical protein